MWWTWFWFHRCWNLHELTLSKSFYRCFFLVRVGKHKKNATDFIWRFSSTFSVSFSLLLLFARTLSFHYRFKLFHFVCTLFLLALLSIATVIIVADTDFSRLTRLLRWRLTSSFSNAFSYRHRIIHCGRLCESVQKFPFLLMNYVTTLWLRHYRKNQERKRWH